MRQANAEQQEVHIAELTLRRRDGTSFPVEYWSHPVVQAGRIHGAVATFFDISERLAMQAALRQGELRIVKLVDAVTDGVITVDSDGRIVLFNRAAEALFGVAAAEAIGGPIDRFIPYRPARRFDPAMPAIHGRRKRQQATRHLAGADRHARQRRRIPARGVAVQARHRSRRPHDGRPARHHRAAPRPCRAAGTSVARGRESRQDRVPVADEPRAANSPQRRARLRPAASSRRGAAADASSSSAASSTSRTPARTCSRSSTTSSTCRASNRAR